MSVHRSDFFFWIQNKYKFGDTSKQYLSNLNAAIIYFVILDYYFRDRLYISHLVLIQANQLLYSLWNPHRTFGLLCFSRNTTLAEGRLL